jgi:uncharacterized protein YndB with AHSA1/START domain
VHHQILTYISSTCSFRGVIDVRHQINEVRRTVGRRALEAGEARVVSISQSFDTDLDDLWDACTNIERLARWFLPVTGDLRAGGKYQFEGNAGGTIERCDPPKSFAATWEYGDEVSWVEVTLSADADGRARFLLEHTAPVTDENWVRFGPGMVGIGWDGAILGLALHLAGRTMGTQAALEWMATEAGKQFMRASSERWREASIAGGEPEEAARAAEQRVTDAYVSDTA